MYLVLSNLQKILLKIIHQQLTLILQFSAVSSKIILLLKKRCLKGNRNSREVTANSNNCTGTVC